MEALKTTQQAPSPSFCSFMPDLRGINCLDLFVGVTRGRLKCGFGTCVDPLLLVGFLAGRLPSSSAASSRIVGFGFQSLLEKWKFGGFKFDGCCPLSKFQNLRCHLVAVSFAWKNSGPNLDIMCNFYLCSHDAWIHFGSCMWNFKGLMVLRSFFHGNIVGPCSFAIYILKLDANGIKCVSSKCFFCIPEMREDDDLAKDGNSCLCGSIH
ncbi:hypothetical protein BRADI_2g30625v3 [Brachypodium distachyon]|uniref:Uncharacterized protein n=1 Tax=Brachypodium distachyon TaxID=15368 RepID=A0A2K2DB93_BRADI|nr:hypothetical protein BRADI_2g30625v3 [Brachypodium distachyon]